MALKIVRFLSIFLTAVAFGLAYAHVMEAPGARTLSGAEWLAVQHTFYGGFAVSGGVGEVGGLAATLVALYLVRGHRVAFIWTLVAALCLALMLVVFAVGNNPLNARIATWTPATLPGDWRQVREAWDNFHATSAALAAVGLAAQIIATLSDYRVTRRAKPPA
ncbi:MAG TPA: hypothetical protein VJQ45_03110 [Ktedonobacterales bacterium]|nr:hypothetical protein [Ktedonobacterales bacterium]